MVRGELRRAHDLSARLVALAEEQRTPVRRALARRARGTTLVLLGRFADAEAALKEGIAIDDAVADWEDPAHLLLYTERAGVVCRLHSAWTFWFLGFPDRALESVEAGLALGRRLTHVPSLAFALIWAALLHNLRREFAEARGRAEAAIQIAERASPYRSGLLSQTYAGPLLWSALVSGRRGSHSFRLVWRTGTGPAHACSIPSGLVSRRKPALKPVGSTTRSRRWIGRPQPPRPPASATIKRSSIG